jgi:serine protease
MKRLRMLLLALAILIFMPGISHAQADAYDPARAAFLSDPAYTSHPYRVDGEIVVDFRDSTPMAEIEKLEKELGVDLGFVSPHSQEERLMRGYVGEAAMAGVLKRLRSDSRVEYAEPDYYFHTYAPVPDDPLYKYQWNMEKINLRGGWDLSRGSGVIVAVIDTGVAYGDYGRFHRLEDLEKTLFVKGYNFVDRNDRPFDDHAHGSHVAGTIAQTTNNGRGVAGIAPMARIMPLKVLSANGFGRVSDIADAVRYATDNGAKVINMSLGGPYPSQVLQSACEYAWKKGVVIVCAAGNSNSTRVGYPAGYKVCLAVSSTRFDDQLAPYSNRGPDIDIAAPGGDTTVDQNGDGRPDGILQNTIEVKTPDKEGYYLFQGTSMASPHVAGVAALVASTGVSGNREIVDILKKSARKKGLPLEKGYGAGILDARGAVLAATVGKGWVKLVIAIVLLIILILFLGPAVFAPARLSLQFYLALLFGSCGLFFLPLLAKGPIPAAGFLTKGFTDWDTLLLGASSHANPLFAGAIVPLILGLVLYKTRLQKGAAGFSLGVAASLLYCLLFSPADVQWIPGTFVLDKLWLLVNMAGALVMASVLLMPDEKKDLKEGDVAAQ